MTEAQFWAKVKHYRRMPEEDKETASADAFIPYTDPRVYGAVCRDSGWTWVQAVDMFFGSDMPVKDSTAVEFFREGFLSAR